VLHAIVIIGEGFDCRQLMQNFCVRGLSMGRDYATFRA
jgi:hypothetical protein